METTARNDVPERRTLIGVFSDLWRETSMLFRAEAELAKVELGEKISQIQTALVSLAIGGAILLAAILVLLDAVVNALAMALPPAQAPWLAPLIVGIVVAVVGVAVLPVGATLRAKEVRQRERA